MLAGWDDAVRRFRQVVPVPPPAAVVYEASQDSPEEVSKNSKSIGGVA
jgi:hypothetical protein